jgi:uncharacterized protein (TIGR02246 family)
MTGDEQQIRELIEKWMKASSAGDTATVLGLMDDDVMFLVAGQKPFGKQEFAEMNKKMKDVKLEASSQIREIQSAGDWAWCRSEVDVTSTSPGEKPVRRAGQVLTIFRKKPDGTWVLARDANLLALVGK